MQTILSWGDEHRYRVDTRFGHLNLLNLFLFFLEKKEPAVWSRSLHSNQTWHRWFPSLFCLSVCCVFFINLYLSRTGWAQTLFGCKKCPASHSRSFNHIWKLSSRTSATASSVSHWTTLLEQWGIRSRFKGISLFCYTLILNFTLVFEPFHLSWSAEMSFLNSNALTR